MKRLLVLAAIIVLIPVSILSIHAARVLRIEMRIHQNSDDGDFMGNINLYNEMIKIDGSSRNYVNRASNCVLLKEYDMAVSDIAMSLSVDHKSIGEAIAVLLTIEARVSDAEYARLMSLLTEEERNLLWHSSVEKTPLPLPRKR